MIIQRPRKISIFTNFAEAASTAAQATITAYAQNNTGTLPSTADYATAGGEGLAAGLDSARNAALARAPEEGSGGGGGGGGGAGAGGGGGAGGATGRPGQTPALAQAGLGPAGCLGPAA